MKTTTRDPRLQSFLNGIVMPIPGGRSLERQIELEYSAAMDDSLTRLFALGHMLAAMPLITVMVVGLFMVMEYRSF